MWSVFLGGINDIFVYNLDEHFKDERKTPGNLLSKLSSPPRQHKMFLTAVLIFLSTYFSVTLS
jgi:hypothetical protein